MNSVIADRLECITSILSRKEEVRHVAVSDGIRSALKWYGLHRFLINSRLSGEPIDDRLEWLDLGRFGIAWPRNHPHSRFIGALIELRAPSNSHFYFDRMTEVREGTTVADVGASEGTFAVECLIKYKAAQVWCFEPDSSMHHALDTTAERNNLAGRLHVVPAAVAAMSGHVQILENSADPLASYCIDRTRDAGPEQGPGILKTVRCTTLDEWAGQSGIERLDYLKIDAEGSDLAVLQGARQCLQRWRPAIAVTTYHRAEHCNEMIEYLSSLALGYRFKAKGVIVFDSVARPVMLHAASYPAVGTSVI
jgi:FkbM family methyltransferase